MTIQTTAWITCDNSQPIVNVSSVTFSARLLSSNGSPLAGKSLTIAHYGVGGTGPYYDLTANTNSSGYIYFTQSAYTSTGMRTYYSYFNGGGGYNFSTSDPLYIYVVLPQSGIYLSVDNTAPTINQQITFNCTLHDVNQHGLSGKSITFYYIFNQVLYTGSTLTTNSYGQVTLNVTFTTTGVRQYYAHFAGDSYYQGSYSSTITITVSGSSGPQPISSAESANLAAIIENASGQSLTVGEIITLAATIESDITVVYIDEIGTLI